eukprot:CAMPEP_0202397576 /NCGR_PEP_ID=MMETSP1128-20130828/675_1 /ASSEMBLY_ACC=CAM_ASM_000463 /TAXON_ID=3047 /ORGANISM="Dunaliella tertiolecta, Strain CCMP1320" /LENGTH=118 /DNA_ID=CAMNT_0049000519 /DNA_START=468 /DNA_END=820 /DNA_ORIENTATION=+
MGLGRGEAEHACTASDTSTADEEREAQAHGGPLLVGRYSVTSDITWLLLLSHPLQAQWWLEGEFFHSELFLAKCRLCTSVLFDNRLSLERLGQHFAPGQGEQVFCTTVGPSAIICSNP